MRRKLSSYDRDVSRLVDLQQPLQLHKQAVLNEVWTVVAAADVAEQHAPSVNPALAAAAEQNSAGGPSELNNPTRRGNNSCPIATAPSLAPEDQQVHVHHLPSTCSCSLASVVKA